MRKIIFERSVGSGVQQWDSADHNLVLTSVDVSPLIAKTDYVNVMGRMGSIDLSTVLTNGVPVFEDRTVTYSFYLDLPINEWDNWKTENLGFIAGYRCAIYEYWQVSEETDWHWSGRLTSFQIVPEGSGARVTMILTVDPVRYVGDVSTNRETVDTVRATRRINTKSSIPVEMYVTIIPIDDGAHGGQKMEFNIGVNGKSRDYDVTVNSSLNTLYVGVGNVGENSITIAKKTLTELNYDLIITCKGGGYL